jgi:hypothetical protein
MSKFKRASLLGSEELFRQTRPQMMEKDEVMDDVLDPTATMSPGEQPHLLSLTQEEIDLLIEAVQLAKYPDKPRPKPPLHKFERLDLLKSKLQG